MNREIKFRVWDSKNSVWCMVSLQALFWNSSGNGGWSEDAKLSLNGPEKEFIFQQFTGLKDKTGREIYEGDIIEFTNSEWGEDEKFKSQVFFVGSSFNVWADGHINGDLCASLDDESWDFDNLKVIGNIFENSELLK